VGWRTIAALSVHRASGFRNLSYGRPPGNHGDGPVPYGAAKVPAPRLFQAISQSESLDGIIGRLTTFIG